MGWRAEGVKRTFTWIMKNLRFARDDEQLTTVAETLIVIAACATPENAFWQLNLLRSSSTGRRAYGS